MSFASLLNQQYESIKEEKELKSFLYKLANYLKIINERKETNDILAELDKNKENDYQTINKLLPIALKELKETYKKVQIIIRKLNISEKRKSNTFVTIQDNIDLLKLHNKDLCTIDNIKSIAQRISDIIHRLYSLGYREHIQEIIEEKEIDHSPDENPRYYITRAILSKSYDKLIDELQKLDRLKKNKAWYFWEKIKLIYQLSHQGEIFLDSLSKNKTTDKDIVFYWQYQSAYHEFNQILDTGSGRTNFFDIKNLKLNFELLHGYLINKLPMESNPKNRTQVQYEINQRKLITKNIHGDFLIDNKPIEINRNSLPYILFNILFESHDQNGCLKYDNFEKELRKLNTSTIKPEDNRDKIKKRVHNALVNNNQGFFRIAKINNNRIKNQAPDGKKIITVVRGEGLKLHNPIITE